MPAKRVKKTSMLERDAKLRAKDFIEVNEGYTMTQAAFEAERCLRCQDPRCVAACPVHIPIPEFIHEVATGNMAKAAKILRTSNPLPAVCGRVCPQEDQCEKICHMATRFKPVGIGYLERFVADWERAQSQSESEVTRKPSRTERIAIIGAGPAGLVCAGDLARLGYPVTVFEGLHAPGGVLRYGIPEFRLPNDILDWEISLLKDLGVEIICNVVVGKTIQLDDLFDKMGFSAVFIGTGAGLPRFLGVPGENLNGVYSANEFLTRINLMQSYNFPESDTPLYLGKRVAVIGAGNTAMDAIRSALRVGAEEGMSIYRRTEKEMTARVEEYHHAIDEGVKFHWLTNPIEVVGNEEGWVTGIKCMRMKLGKSDDSGRARPEPIEDSEFTIPVDNVVLSLGNSPNPLLVNNTPGLETNKHGCLIVKTDKKSETSRKWVYAGGDAVSGAATVILAAGAGKDAAAVIHQDLSGVSSPQNA